MRTEPKVGIVLGLVVIVMAIVYLVGRNDEQPVEIGTGTVVEELKVPELGRTEQQQDQDNRTAAQPPGQGEQPDEVLPSPPWPQPAETVAGQEPDATQPARYSLVRTVPVIKSMELPPEGDKPIDGTARAGKPVLSPTDQPKIIIIPAQETDDAVVPDAKAAEPKTVEIADTTKSIYYIVKPEDSLYKIAQEFYGRGEMWPVIARANPQLTDPGKLAVGQKLTVPPAGKALREFEGLDSISQGKAGELRPYKVKPGESFFTIAQDQLGDGGRWQELFKLNRKLVDGNPRKLQAGQTIYLPGQ